MSISYGAITITDTTDLGQLSVYLTASTVRQQIYDQNGGTTTFYPDWSKSGEHLLITPHVYFNGQSKTITDNNILITWSKEEEGREYPLPVSPTTDRCPEIINNKVLERPTNLYYPDSENNNENAHIIGTGTTYKAAIRYYPISGDPNIFLESIATLDITIANNGIDGLPGPQAKSLQLVGNGSYFTYHYDGSLFGASKITLTAKKSSTVSGVHWYCKKASSNTYIPIKVIGGYPSTDVSATGWEEANYYTTLSIEFGGEQIVNQVDIIDLVADFITERSAQFKVVEIDSSGNEIENGLEDYISIYALVEAAPGQDTYSSYLSNDEETIVDINGTPILDNAITQLFISQSGADDLANWHISVSHSPDSESRENFDYILSNSKDSGGSTTYLNKYGPDKVKVTKMNGNAALITFTAVHGVYNGDTFISDANNPNIPAADKVSNIIKTFSLTKSAAIISHSLRLDTVNANEKIENQTRVYVPSSVTVDAITRMAGGTEEYRNAGVISAVVHLVGGGLYNFGTEAEPVFYTSNVNNEPLILTLANYGNISYIDTYLGGTYNSTTYIFEGAEDKQKITISTDGTDGEDGDPAWNFMLGNHFDGISTDFANVSSGRFIIDIPVQAVEGSVQKTIYNGGQVYPTITGDTLLSTITPQYYNGENVSSTGEAVTNIQYVIPANTNIGATGSVTLRLTYAAGKTLTQTYTYKAQPEALKPIRIFLTATPTDTFENQDGTITVTPTAASGTTPIPIPSSGFTWEQYTENETTHEFTWTQITSTDTSDSIYLNSSNLVVKGAAVKGYLALRFSTPITEGGITEIYTEYINLKDIDDPLQVHLHSTLGEQIVNGQGIGVIYARVIRKGDSEDYDTVVPDNLLGIGTVAPQSASGLTGKTGYCYIHLNNEDPPKPTGQVDYYWRASSSDSWSGPRGNSTNPYKYKYTWTFRDSNNASYISGDSSTPPAITYAMNINNNTQFIPLNGSIVKNKLITIVKVEYKKLSS